MAPERDGGPACVFEVAWGAATDQGRVRSRNEDAWYAGTSVFVVADGMGGHTSGEVASRSVVDSFRADDDLWLTPEVLHEALDSAVARVRGLPAPGRAPGSTVVGVGLAAQAGVPCWLVFNVGDSRAYRLSAGLLEQISVDHSRVQELKDAGVVIEAGPRRNIITKAIGGGVRGPVSADQWLMPALAGDRILLCSDGLTGEVSDQLIAATLLAFRSPQSAAEQLVSAAVNAGGRDNVTVVVVDAVRVGSADARHTDVMEGDTLSDLADPNPTVPDINAFMSGGDEPWKAQS